MEAASTAPASSVSARVPVHATLVAILPEHHRHRAGPGDVQEKVHLHGVVRRERRAQTRRGDERCEKRQRGRRDERAGGGKRSHRRFFSPDCRCFRDGLCALTGASSRATRALCQSVSARCSPRRRTLCVRTVRASVCRASSASAEASAPREPLRAPGPRPRTSRRGDDFRKCILCDSTIWACVRSTM